MKYMKYLAVAGLAGVIGTYAMTGQAAVTSEEFLSSTKAPKPGYSVALNGQDETMIGGALITKTAKGLFVMVDIYNLPEGWHSIHFHAKGDCSDHSDHFKKSGGHAAKEGQEHGYFSEKGPHSGDLPNFYVGKDKRAKFHIYTTDMPLEQLTDEDGTALVIHAKADDYASQPAGEAGDRLACGVVTEIPVTIER